MEYKVLQGKIVKDQANATISDEDLTMRWHGRLGHVSYGFLILPLISMAMLDQEGFNVKIENGVVMVFTRILVCNERED